MISFLARLTLLLLLAAEPLLIRAGAQPLLRWQGSGVEASNLPDSLLKRAQLAKTPAEWQETLAVFPGENPQPGLPPMAGHYGLTNGVLRFTPAFPLDSASSYIAILQTGSSPALRAVLHPGRVKYTKPRIEAAYPAVSIVPENLLKFYLYFSEPMSRGGIYEHIHLLDERDKAVELPFLEINEELWDREMKRLTLFIDPGRIKRGVRPLEEIGPALQEGHSFTLAIDPQWQDAHGQPLARRFEKKFRVGPPDRTPPAPATWKMHVPRAGSRGWFSLAFGEPMDHALALRMIHVIDARGIELAGRIELTDEDRLWKFQPAQPWPEGALNVVIETTIEDLAGNNIGKPFEVDLFENVDRQLSSSTVKLRFSTLPSGKR